MRGAVLRDISQPIAIENDMVIDDPGPGEVRVKLAASGICHSDLSAVNGTVPAMLPMVLGHEGAGVITNVGAGVSSVAVGDHVVIAVSPPCGHCHVCAAGDARLCSTHTATALGSTRFRVDGQPLFAMAGIGAFAEEVVLGEYAVVKVPE